MKKILTLFMALTLVFVLSACGSKADDASSAVTVPGKAVGTTDAATEVIFKASAKTFTFDQAEYRVKKGEAVKLTLQNVDGVHGVSIKELNVELKGAKLSQVVTPDKAGTYEISCIVICGTGHMTMKSKLIVE
ncbi:MAG: cytochrome c oxidase subunit [Bacilli bacterium]|nr:cytochrome c oxidase subunit [Bacilli bacterium]